MTISQILWPFVQLRWSWFCGDRLKTRHLTSACVTAMRFTRTQEYSAFYFEHLHLVHTNWLGISCDILCQNKSLANQCLHSSFVIEECLSFPNVSFRWNILERMISKNGTNKRVSKTKQHNNKQRKQNKQKIKQRKSDNVIFFKYFTQIERSAHLSGLLNCIFLVAVPTILVVSISYWWDFIWVSTYYLKLSISVSELNQFLIKPGRACLKIYRFWIYKDGVCQILVFL